MIRIARQTGFTVVELLIVIVVIAILAAITIVAYNGIQAQAYDARIKTGVSQIEKAAHMWVTNHGMLPSGGGYGSTAKNADGTCTGGAGGWINTNSYVCTIEDMLLADKLIPSSLIPGLPPNKAYGGMGSGALTLMFYPCGGANTRTYAIFYYLNNPNADDAANVTAAEAKGCPTTPRTVYGMRGARIVTF